VLWQVDFVQERGSGLGLLISDKPAQYAPDREGGTRRYAQDPGQTIATGLARNEVVETIEDTRETKPAGRNWTSNL